MPNKFEPVYKDMQFQNYIAYNEWLQRTYQYIINVKDTHQNSIKLWCADSGEILTSNAQNLIANGNFVNVKVLVIGYSIQILNDETWVYSSFRIESVQIKKTGNNSFDEYIDDLAKQIR